MHLLDRITGGVGNAEDQVVQQPITTGADIKDSIIYGVGGDISEGGETNDVGSERGTIGTVSIPRIQMGECGNFRQRYT
ncbi:13879_t:CDS:1, partial [Dentiscutata heterogama]